MSTYNIIYQVDASGTQVVRPIEAVSEAGALLAARFAHQRKPGVVVGVEPI